jgi:hypothetical protein
MNRRQALLAVFAAFCVGVAMRSWPLWHSPLPFNPDGIVYARKVHSTVRTGHFPLFEMAVDDVAFTGLLSTVSLVTGVDTLYHSQGVAAIIGTLPVLLVAAIAHRVARLINLIGGKRQFAVALGAWTLAIEGLYLHRSMPVDEQTVGLFLAPLAVLAVVYGATRDRRWWIVAAPALLVLPAVHNLDAFVVALVVTMLAVIAIRQPRLRTAGAYVFLAVGYWTWLVAYMVGLETFTPASIVQQARLTAVPGLLVAWLVLVGVGLVWFIGQRPQVKRVLLSTVLLGWFGVLGVNALGPIFPGLPATNPTILYGIAPLVVLVALFGLALPPALDVDAGTAMVAQLAAVVVIVGVSLTAALTAEYLNTLYRVQTFAHLPVIAIASVGAGLLLGTKFGIVNRVCGRTLARTIACIVLVASVASIPIAYGGLDVLTYKGVTTTAEFESTGFAHEHVPGAWTSDDHLTRLGRYYTDSNGSVQPTYAFLTGSDPPMCPTLSKASWTTVGGQLYPREPASITVARYDELQATSHRVYDTGGTDRITLTLPREPTVTGCQA